MARELDTSWKTRLAIAVAALLFVSITIYGIASLMCEGSIRTCVPGEECPNKTVCTDYGQGKMRCSPRFCYAVKTYVRLPPEMQQWMNWATGKIGQLGKTMEEWKW